jgi:hypothetical protein
MLVRASPYFEDTVGGRKKVHDTLCHRASDKNENAFPNPARCLDVTQE